MVPNNTPNITLVLLGGRLASGNTNPLAYLLISVYLFVWIGVLFTLCVCVSALCVECVLFGFVVILSGDSGVLFLLCFVCPVFRFFIFLSVSH